MIKNVVIAIDSFKGSLSSMDAGHAIKAGILRVFPEAQIAVSPLADGGEGTVDALVTGMKGVIHQVNVSGPLGENVVCKYGILEDGKTAIIEMSGAAGITLVEEKERNPLNTTTFGVGQVIVDAIQKGCRRFIVGIGGSATNDGGIGMLQALGYGILDEAGEQVERSGSGLSRIVKITDENVIPQLKDCQFRIACDVTNPLCGDMGCSAVYGPQKGATPEIVHNMDRWLHNYSMIAKQFNPKADDLYPGTGAAGGLGYAFLTFTNAVLESGISIVLDETHLSDLICKADVVITGEGRIDQQTAMGKAPIGVAKLAKKYNKPVIGLAGCVTKEATLCNKEGMDAFFPILRRVVSLEEAMNHENTTNNIQDTIEQIFRVIKAFTQ